MLLCVLCWSTSGLFIKFIDWHPMVISGMRSGIAALFMLAVKRGSMFRCSGSPGGSPARGKTGVVLLLAAAGFSAATKILYVLANKLTSPANAILLHHSAPVWAAFLGWAFIGEAPRKKQWAALTLICVGLAILFNPGFAGQGSLGYGSLAGDAIALAAGLCFGASMVFLRMNRDASPALCLFLSHCIPLTLGIPFFFIRAPVFTGQNVGAILFLGIVQVGIASLLYAYAIKRLRAIDAIFIDQLEPVLNPFWIFIFSGEIPGAFSVIGGIIIIGAVLLNARELNIPRIKSPRRDR
jgi:drug/metabolite transporter (DMT)-like permease